MTGRPQAGVHGEKRLRIPQWWVDAGNNGVQLPHGTHAWGSPTEGVGDGAVTPET